MTNLNPQEIKAELNHAMKYSQIAHGEWSSDTLNLFQTLSNTIVGLAESQQVLLERQKQLEEKVFQLEQEKRIQAERTAAPAQNHSIRKSFDLRQKEAKGIQNLVNILQSDAPIPSQILDVPENGEERL